MLEPAFKEILSFYTADPLSIRSLWEEIYFSYTRPGRKYHNLQHLENVYKELTPVKHTIRDWDILVFSVAYHDIVYNTLKQDNEEKSAGLAASRLSRLDIPKEKIEACTAQIIATKNHALHLSADTNYFTDADLSVLGYELPEYLLYTSRIRQEYRYYPDLVYKPGRRKVLKKFLDMGRIFKTTHFHDLYETQARANIIYELKALQ